MLRLSPSGFAVCTTVLVVLLSHQRSVALDPLPPPIPADSARSLIHDRACDIVTILAKKDIAALTTFIHPTLHLRFSPYGFIGQSNRVFDSLELSTAWKSKQQFFWGRYDGTGKPIRRTLREYFKRFVYDRDYLSSACITYNHIQRSDKFVNVFDVYPQSIVVDYLFLAQPEFEEMDWRALRLVFAEYEGTWYLVHIVHDEWTV